MVSIEFVLGLGAIIGIGFFLWARQNILVGK